jgi:hypothetical protein
MLKDKKVTCDYCDNEVSEEDCYSNKKGFWAWGKRGQVGAFGVSGFCEEKVKYACPNELCKAKLMVWAHS